LPKAVDGTDGSKAASCEFGAAPPKPVFREVGRMSPGVQMMAPAEEASRPCIPFLALGNARHFSGAAPEIIIKTE
jgi:hypothetical protein